MSSNHALKAALKQHYGIDGELHPLVGELDENFLVEAPGRKLVFKLMRRGCDRRFVEMQVAALAHVQRAKETVATPAVIETLTGHRLIDLDYENGPRIGWLISFLPGHLLDSGAASHRETAWNIGRSFAQLDGALADFDHPHLSRDLGWDLLNAGWIADHIEAHATDERRRIIEAIVERYRSVIHPNALDAPRAVIHNDGNDRNILVDDGGTVSGILDFGDMVRSVRIGEAAIAAAYVMMLADDPIEGALSLLAGFASVAPVTEIEAALFFPLILTRAAVSATNAAIGALENPENGYLQVSMQPAWSLLYRYHDAEPTKLEELALRALDRREGPFNEMPSRRRRHFATNQRLSYREPFMPVRGRKHYLIDFLGRTFIDAYNNVPHVGHAHPAVAEAVATQMRELNTNSRYLTEPPLQLAEKLCARLPASLSKVFLLNSASEANEVALRLARAATGARNLLVMQHGYHGCTTGAVDISPYKYNHPKGGGAPEWVYEIPQPDLYRGDFWRSHPNDVAPYVAAVEDAIERASIAGGLSGFISECLPSVGGQIVLPDGYLQSVYDRVRRAGGVCIADDVQTGLGRLGRYFWGYEQQAVTPDILVLGKPLGNGFPLAAVVTTAEIAAAFSEGPEFFSTFGGSSASAAAGLAVLDALEREGLVESAAEVGAYLGRAFAELKARHPCVGEVRGMGLFWGLDLIEDAESRAPATALASQVKEALYRRHILVGTDGPHDNVLKVRPPMTFDREAGERVVTTLGEVLNEATTSHGT